MAQQRKFKEVTSELFKFEKPGDSTEGVFIERKLAPPIGGSKEDNYIYRVKNDAGVVVSFFGTALLNNRMATIGRGEYIRVTYEKDEPSKKTGHSDMKIFKVEVATE